MGRGSISSVSDTTPTHDSGEPRHKQVYWIQGQARNDEFSLFLLNKQVC